MFHHDILLGIESVNVFGFSQHKASLVQGYYIILLLWYNNIIMLCSKSYIILFSKINIEQMSLAIPQYLMNYVEVEPLSHESVIHTYNAHTCMYVRHDNVYCECCISSRYGLWV